MQILDRAKLWKEGMMEQIKREITIMKDLRESHIHPYQDCVLTHVPVWLLRAFLCYTNIHCPLDT